MQKLLWIAFLLLPLFLRAQQDVQDCVYTLKGTVIDRHNKEVLPYATVVVKILRWLLLAIV